MHQRRAAGLEAVRHLLHRPDVRNVMRDRRGRLRRNARLRSMPDDYDYDDRDDHHVDDRTPLYGPAPGRSRVLEPSRLRVGLLLRSVLHLRPGLRRATPDHLHGTGRLCRDRQSGLSMQRSHGVWRGFAMLWQPVLHRRFLLPKGKHWGPMSVRLCVRAGVLLHDTRRFHRRVRRSVLVRTERQRMPLRHAVHVERYLRCSVLLPDDARGHGRVLRGSARLRLLGCQLPSCPMKGALGRGATQPITSNDTESGRAQNRRLELVVMKK